MNQESARQYPLYASRLRTEARTRPCTWHVKTEQAGNGLGKLFLNCKDVLQLTAEGFGPEVMSGFSLNCLRSDPQLVTRLPDASFNKEIRVETPADFARIDGHSL